MTTAARTKDDLKLGMIVEVRGSAIDNSSGSPASTASSITFNSEMVGKIDSLNVGAQSLVVFGQTVNVKTTTVFDGSLSNGLQSLAANDVVEVYGLLDAITGQYTATRIELKSGTTTEYRLRGKVSNLDSVAKAFNIGTERISYLSLAAADVPAGFANDMIVRIRVNSARAGNVWAATRLRDGASRPDDQSHARVEGLISSFNSITQFSVAGVPVTTSGATAFPDGQLFGLGNRVEVEGTMMNGVLAASKVEIETDSGSLDFDFRGPIEAVGAQTITVRGTTISVSGAIEFRPNTQVGHRSGAGRERRSQGDAGERQSVPGHADRVQVAPPNLPPLHPQGFDGPAQSAGPFFGRPPTSKNKARFVYIPGHRNAQDRGNQ